MKKVHENIGALAVQDTKKKEQIGYLEYSLLMIKICYISPKFPHFIVFGVKVIKE